VDGGQRSASRGPPPRTAHTAHSDCTGGPASVMRGRTARTAGRRAPIAAVLLLLAGGPSLAPAQLWERLQGGHSSWEHEERLQEDWALGAIGSSLEEPGGIPGGRSGRRLHGFELPAGLVYNLPAPKLAGEFLGEPSLPPAPDQRPSGHRPANPTPPRQPCFCAARYLAQPCVRHHLTQATPGLLLAVPGTPPPPGRGRVHRQVPHELDAEGGERARA
jgi:hypothetical protein